MPCDSNPVLVEVRSVYRASLRGLSPLLFRLSLSGPYLCCFYLFAVRVRLTSLVTDAVVLIHISTASSLLFLLLLAYRGQRCFTPFRDGIAVIYLVCKAGA
jgi:hypothetical protein